jgi:4-hydroxybenzoate polyprenyltransferase
VLDGLVVAAVAIVAGADVGLAIRLGVSMTLLQFGIGSVNDIVDSPYDAGRKAGKPIPAGLVSARAARVGAIACFGGGVALALTVSPAVAFLAGLVIAIGLAYDLRLKGTAWSWAPFAAGIPLLPVYGWLGATGTLHPMFGALVPAAVLAGAAPAIANSLVDVERDRAAGRTSIAAELGPDRAARLGASLLAIVAAVDAVALLVAGVAGGPAGLIGLGSVLAVLLAVIVAARASRGAARRERWWRVQALSLGVAGVAFVVAAIR